jgi:hypothetical protein
MALDANLVGGASGNKQEVTSAGLAKVVTETNASANAASIGGIRVFAENDQGLITGLPRLASPEVDVDYRMRASQDLMLDEEVLNYVSQNTGKHTLTGVTMGAAFISAGMRTNSSSITTGATGVGLSTYAYFPCTGTQTLGADMEVSFSAQPNANTFIEFGFGLPGTAIAAPTDGVFFRLSSGGLQGVASYAGTETNTAFFNLSNGAGLWVYQNSKNYQFILYLNATSAEFWVNDGTGAVKLGEIPLPAGSQRMVNSASLPFMFKHRITGGSAGAVFQSILGAYSVRQGGSNQSTTVATQGNRMFGSYQGLSGGTLGTIASIGAVAAGNETNKTAAVPTGTTAALGTGIGGTFWETASVAVATDLIIQSYQVPIGTIALAVRRLVIRGVYLSSYVQTALTAGGFVQEWFLAFGHTAVSLATAEAATTKAPRRIPLPFLQLYPAAAAAFTFPTASGGNFIDFGDCPIYINPGEFLQLCCRKQGTASSAGTIVHRVTYAYGWE